MTNYFSNIDTIKYEGESSQNPFAYRYYDAKRQVLGKTMAEHLRLAVCYWHTFCWQGEDNFGAATFDRKWQQSSDPIICAEQRAQAAFDFFDKLQLPFFTFHDRDVIAEGDNLVDSQQRLNHIADIIAEHMSRTDIKLLWGTANLFSHRRYMAGAATNPNPEVFAYACAQIKAALDVTHRLQGENYVLWGGREGYDSLLNTDMKRETEQMARFLSMLVDYKHKIGFKGLFLIEPKPCEPTKHQYDFDSATVFAFLQKYGLEKEFKVNIEANHATLAGHRFAHEINYAYANNIFGSIDANRGDPQLGWDTDQFPINLHEISLVLYVMLKNGGFTSGGFNFDTKLRRQSIDLQDIFYAHISGVDTLARGLLIAAKMIENKTLSSFTEQRYADWDHGVGKEILTGKIDFSTLAEQANNRNIDPQPVSGRQEYLENEINHCI